MKLNRNDPCWCGSGKKYKFCHENFDRRVEKERLAGHRVPGHNLIKTPEQIEKIKESAKINMECLDEVAAAIHEGMATIEIDEIINTVTRRAGAIPAPLNYGAFPKSVCTSVNDQVCHGIPSKDVILKEGDIVNVDCSTILDGYYSDSSRMFIIGKTDEKREKLVRVAKECCDLGLKEVRPWGYLGDIAEAIHTHAEKNGFNVVREIGGHGVGLEFHEDPFVSYVTNRGEEMLLAPGLMFTIEPMVNAGTYQFYTDDTNHWEVYTLDGEPSAQWEYQVVVTEDGYELISW